ncbi:MULTISPECIES: hypothetical protein [Yersinia]|uniref:hypothetical protein n=1 Tax=Yersinia TaxID=629 RepID=UPI0005E69F53|nr:hypothetical protein [Yersinia intermedia]CQD74129.1 Uncharacterised protein [Yersinia intermedia]
MRNMPKRRDQVVSAKPTKETRLSSDEQKKLSESFKAFTEANGRQGYFFKK